MSLEEELARLKEITEHATPGPWYNEPPTGAGRVWVQIGRGYPEVKADCEPLFNLRHVKDPVTEEQRQREYRQRAADAEFIATARTAMPLLLGAVIAVLEDHRPGRIVIYGSLCRHHENHRYFSITSTEADDVRACPDCTATVYSACTGCGPQVSADACPVRSAIGRELAGKDSSDEK